MADQGAGASDARAPSAFEDPILAPNRIGRFEWDLDRRRLHLDESALSVYGLSADTYDGRAATVRALLPEDERRRVDSVLDKAVRSGVESYGLYFRVRRHGALRWVHAHGVLERDAEGRARRIRGVVRDATDELQASAPAPVDRQGDGKLATVVQHTITALARAHTVQDVIEVLRDNHDVERLGTASMALGLVEGGRLRIVAASPSDRLVPGTEVTRLEESYPTNDAVRTGRPLFIESPEGFRRSYPHLWESFGAYRLTAAAYLPLIAQAHPIGVLGLHYHDKEVFTDEERSLLLALASSVAQSLQRAMFYDEARDLAQKLQQAMLPHSIPHVPHADVAVRYRSASVAREIGGDWYDLIPLPQGRFGAVIGDVQGHDTHAAAVMGQLRIVLRAYAAEGHTPATVMSRASAFLHELDTERFATCVYAEVDSESGVLQVVRAGHPPPLVRATDGTCRQIDVAGGLPLGHSQEFGLHEYEATTVQLGPGQTLLLYTDGLVEPPGVGLDEGVAALAARVRSGPDDLEQLADLLCGEVDNRIGEGEDDLALLLLRRLPEPDRATTQLRREVVRDDPAALAGTRNMIRTAGRALGAARRCDEVELVADELITNVLVHTDGPATVTLRLLKGERSTLRVEVEDASSALPRRREADESGVTGRGLVLVDQLADRWGVEARGRGKCVWSEFAVPDGGTDGTESGESVGRR